MSVLPFLCRWQQDRSGGETSELLAGRHKTVSYWAKVHFSCKLDFNLVFTISQFWENLHLHQRDEAGQSIIRNNFSIHKNIQEWTVRWLGPGWIWLGSYLGLSMKSGYDMKEEGHSAEVSKSHNSPSWLSGCTSKIFKENLSNSRSNKVFLR